MKIFFVVTFLSLGIFSTVNAAEFSYSQTPSIHIRSDLFEKGDQSARDAAFRDCQETLTEKRNLLVRKGVDIILEENKCSEQLDYLTEQSYFMGSIVFMN